MTSRTQRSDFEMLLEAGKGARTSWSRPISSRANVKLAPCMARPNLFSGD